MSGLIDRLIDEFRWAQSDKQFRINCCNSSRKVDTSPLEDGGRKLLTVEKVISSLLCCQLKATSSQNSGGDICARQERRKLSLRNDKTISA